MGRFGAGKGEVWCWQGVGLMMRVVLLEFWSGGGEVKCGGLRAEWCRGDAGWRRGRLMLREEEEVKCRCCFGTNVSLLFPLF